VRDPYERHGSWFYRTALLALPCPRCDDAPIVRVAALLALSLVVLAFVAPEVLAQAGGGSSGFGGGGGGGGGSGGGGGGGGGSGDDDFGVLDALIFIVLMFFFLGIPATIRRRRSRRAREQRDVRVTTASAEAAEDDPAFAADAVKAQAATLYADVQRAWSERDDAALERMLGDDLLVEWRRRLADFASKGWVNEVTIQRGPEVNYVGLVNREGDDQDRVTVAISAGLHSVVHTSDGAVVKRDEDADEDGVIEVCEYWTLARCGDGPGGWRLVSIEQEQEGTHHLDAPIVAAPWSDDSRLRDESLVELASADAPPAGTAVSELVSVEFEGTAREKALDLSLADPRCSPDVLEVAARQAVDAWAEAIDGDDAALLQLATAQVAHALLYPYGEAQPAARVVVRGPQLQRLAIVALQTDADPPRMQVEAQIAGVRYIEDRDTLALLSGSKDDEIVFAECWTFALHGPPGAPWQLVAD
jgi:predicted lipid-binding transport protein (Tim44 family)